MKLTNRQTGAVGVAKVAWALFRNGYSVLYPMEDFSGYDLVAERNGKFHRIQVKSSSGMEKRRACYRFLVGTGCDSKSLYSPGKVDYVVCYAIDSDMFWLFRTRECRTKNKSCNPKTGSSWRILNDL